MVETSVNATVLNISICIFSLFINQHTIKPIKNMKSFPLNRSCKCLSITTEKAVIFSSLHTPPSTDEYGQTLVSPTTSTSRILIIRTSGFMIFDSETSIMRHPELKSDFVSVMVKSTGFRIVQCKGRSVIVKCKICSFYRNFSLCGCQ